MTEFKWHVESADVKALHTVPVQAVAEIVEGLTRRLVETEKERDDFRSRVAEYSARSQQVAKELRAEIELLKSQINAKDSACTWRPIENLQKEPIRYVTVRKKNGAVYSDVTSCPFGSSFTEFMEIPE